MGINMRLADEKVSRGNRITLILTDVLGRAKGGFG